MLKSKFALQVYVHKSIAATPARTTVVQATKLLFAIQKLITISNAAPDARPPANTKMAPKAQTSALECRGRLCGRPGSTCGLPRRTHRQTTAMTAGTTATL